MSKLTVGQSQSVVCCLPVQHHLQCFGNAFSMWSLFVIEALRGVQGLTFLCLPFSACVFIGEFCTARAEAGMALPRRLPTESVSGSRTILCLVSTLQAGDGSFSKAPANSLSVRLQDRTLPSLHRSHCFCVFFSGITSLNGVWKSLFSLFSSMSLQQHVWKGQCFLEVSPELSWPAQYSVAGHWLLVTSGCCVDSVVF